MGIQMDQVRIYLVGGSNLFRHGLRSYLDGGDFEILGEADGHTEFLNAKDRMSDPDLVLYAKSDAEQDPAAAISEMRARMGETQFLVMAESLLPAEFSDCLSAGISGYLLSDISRDALLHSIKLIMLGEKVFATELARIWMSGGLDRKLQCAKKLEHSLTNRESEILSCLLEGDSNKLIARRLEITESTVKIHMKSLLRKINVQNRTQAAIWAMESGFNSDAAGLTN